MQKAMRMREWRILDARSAMWTRLIFVCAAFSSSSCGAERMQRFEYARPLMGTEFRIVLYGADQARADAAADAAFDRIAELEDELSDYDPQSELARLGRSTDGELPTDPIRVSEDLFDVLALAVEVCDASGGAFDVTVGPYVRLWRRARRQGELPSRARLDEASVSVGRRGLELDPARRTVRLCAPAMRLDLGGIAKGYAVDRALDVLEARGIESALVAGGGDIRLGHAPPGRPGWEIGLVELGAPGSPDAPGVVLADAAISTSGDLERYVELDGKRYSHVIDPRSGWALEERRLVTVIAEDGARADALATAVCVLGAEDGIELVERIRGARAQVTELRGDRREVFRSASFPETERLVTTNAGEER